MALVEALFACVAASGRISVGYSASIMPTVLVTLTLRNSPLDPIPRDENSYYAFSD